MKKVILRNTWLVFSLIFIFLSGCFGGGKNVKKKSTIVTARTIVASGGCIKGRIVDEDGKGFSSVMINTEPNTSTEVTDSKGFFEICYRRKVINAETGETTKVTLVRGQYTLKITKEGYHARPVSFQYAGKTIRLNNMVMVEKTRPLPSVVRTKLKEEKRTSGVGGKSPISE